MKCLICAKFCFNVLCEKCLDSIPLRPSVREVSGVSVYCFFAYSDIDFLLSAKYYAIGSRVYAALGKIAGEYFFSQKAMRDSISQIIENVAFSGVKIIGIDDCVRSFYSHTGVLVREFALAGANSRKKSKDNQAKSTSKSIHRFAYRFARQSITPIYGELKATNQVSYAGKSLAFRQANKRGLTLSAKISSTKKGVGFGWIFALDFIEDFLKCFRVDFAKRLRAILKYDSSQAQNHALAKESSPDSKLDSTLDSKLDLQADSSVDSALESRVNSALYSSAGYVIIVDDIITTGTSFGEAIEVCQKRGLKVLFCLSLCNAAL